MLSGRARLPVLLVEEDPITRLVGVVLDPRTSEERRAAFADFMSNDLSDFPGWCARVQEAAGGLYPADVRLLASADDLVGALPDADALLVESFRVGAAELAAAPHLRAVQKFGMNTDNIDLAACAARGVAVRTLRRRVNMACAEHAFAFMLTFARQLHTIGGLISVEQLEAAGYAPRGFDRRHTAGSGWARVGGFRTLQGSTLGIVGLGEIGREVALRAAAFEMRILYTQRHRLPEAAEQALRATYVPLDELLGQADWVSINLPLTPSTRDLIDRERLARLKPGAFLINVARAETVQRDALLEALRSGHLGGYALDPLYEEPGRPDDELLAFPNVLLTPHVAAQPRFTTLDDTEELIVGIARALGC